MAPVKGGVLSDRQEENNTLRRPRDAGVTRSGGPFLCDFGLWNGPCESRFCRRDEALEGLREVRDAAVDLGLDLFEPTMSRSARFRSKLHGLGLKSFEALRSVHACGLEIFDGMMRGGPRGVA